MAREIIHKKLKVGTLIRINNSNEVGIILGAKWNSDAYVTTQHIFKYRVYVRGKEVSERREDFTVVGES